MPKKKPFKKSDGQIFYLLHRSSTDQAYAQDERPSDFVLVPVESRGSDRYPDTFGGKRRGGQKNRDGGAEDRDYEHSEISNLKDYRRNRGDHINALGFKNDGYDYSQHLKEMGGGYFVGKDGKVAPMPYATKIELPADALPSGIEMKRDLDAITLDHTVMDKDLACALFEDADEDGAFEELDDNFVEQVMQEPEVPDFDFDAHIAKLIEESEKKNMSSKKQAPRGWDKESDLELLKLHGVSKGNGDKFIFTGKDGEEWEIDEEGEEYEDYDDDDDESGEFDSNISDGEYEEEDRKNDRKSSSATNRGQKGGDTVLDLHFERTLEGYGDENLGYISDADEDEVAGHIETDDPLLESALDEFLKEQEDCKLMDGVALQRVQDARKANLEKTRKELWEQGADIKTFDVKGNAKEQQIQQLVWEMEEKDRMEAEKNGAYADLLTCQEYLREERPVEDYDCESVLSTYSILENHPSLIKEPTKFKPHRSRYQRSVEAQYAPSSSSVKSYASNATNRMPSERTRLEDIKIGKGVAKRIILMGKHNLPEGYGPAAAKKGAPTPESTAAALKRLEKKIRLQKKRGERGAGEHDIEGEEDGEDDDDDDKGDNNEEEGGDGNKSQGDDNDDEDDDDNDDEDDDDNDDDDDGRSTFTSATAVSRRRNETLEEKKARKAAVKEEKRMKRTQKKALKVAYKEEAKNHIAIISSQQDINSIPVFKYSS